MLVGWDKAKRQQLTGAGPGIPDDPMRRLVIIEDEGDIARLLEYNFRKAGFEVESFGRGGDGFESIQRRPPDVILLDILLPDEDGLDICRRLRANERFKTVPIVFLTAKGEEMDRVLGLELGGDDYVVKPFSPREVVARVKAVLRCRERSLEKPLLVEAGELRLDSRTLEVWVRGRLVHMTTLEFRLLYFLASNPRRVIGRDRLLDEVWGQDRFVTPRNVDVQIRHLREKIEADPDKPRYLLTVRGAGYRFSAEPVAAEP